MLKISDDIATIYENTLLDIFNTNIVEILPGLGYIHEK